MRSLAPLVLLAILLSPGALAQQAPAAPVAALDEAGSLLALDTDHLTARLRFRVTNPSSAADYVTIPRFDIRWVDTGQTALGVPTPEFGLALAPGETGEMWVRVDVAEPRAGTFTVSVPFYSEANRATSTVRVPLTVAQAPAGTGTVRVRVVDEEGNGVGGASLEATELTATTRAPAATFQPAGPNEWSARLAPGRYAIRASVAGKADGHAFVTLTAGEDERVELRVAPVRLQARLVSMRGTTVSDSVWLLAGSDDLMTIATAPMTHKTPETGGSFTLLRDLQPAWTDAFPAPARDKHAAGPFQALDTAIAVSGDGALVAGFDWNGVLRVRDAEGNELWTTDQSDATNPLYPAGSAFGHGFFTSGAAAFSPDGRTLVAGGSNGWTAAFDSRTGTVLWTGAFGGEVRAVRFTPDGAGVAVGAGDWRMRMLDATTGTLKWGARNEFWPLFFIAMDEGSTRVASGGKDATLRVWDADTGRVDLAVDVWPGFVSGAGISNDSVVFSDWQFGVRRVGFDGEERWFRRFQGANVATTPDGELAFVAWSREGGSGGGLVLLDANGTTLWSAEPDVARMCITDVSPFPAKQLKSVLLADLGGGRLRAAAACIAGGVFVVELEVSAAPAPQAEPRPPGANPPPPPTHGDPPPPTRGPDAEEDAQGARDETPLPWWIVVIAIAAAAARRGRPGASRGPGRRGWL